MDHTIYTEDILYVPYYIHSGYIDHTIYIVDMVMQ